MLAGGRCRRGGRQHLLHTVVKHSLGLVRSERRHQHYVEHPSVHDRMASASDPMEWLSQEQLTHQLDQAVARLAPALREVYRLREYSGLDYDRIADTLGMPIGTVRSRLSRARGALRETLAEVLQPSDG